MHRLFTRAHLALAAITLLAAFLRFYRLDTLPPGFQFDQAFYVFDVLRLLQGQFHIFFTAPGGTEPLFPYLAMPAVALFGDQAFGLRLTGAILGTLTIPAIYWLARTLFTPSPSKGDYSPRSEAEWGRWGEGTRIGLLAALLASISLWHIFFSRYGERVTLLVLLTVLLFQFFWRALSQRHTRDFILTGVFTALALYTYPAARVLPFALIVLTGYVLLTDRSNARRYLQGLVIAGIVALIIFAPLAFYFLQHPDQFFSHSTQVSIFVPHANVSADVGAELVKNILRITGMFFIAGDSGELRNAIPNRPVFDPLTAALFIVGVIVWLIALLAPRSKRVNRRRAVFLLVWLGAILSISLLTDDAPNFVRTLPAMPAVMLLSAWGTSALWSRARTPILRYALIDAVVVAILFGAASSYSSYFGGFAENPATYYTFDTDKVELANWLQREATTNRVWVAPLLAQNGTISLLTRNTPLKSFESKDTIVLPANSRGDAVYVLPWEQQKKFQTLTERLGALGAREELTGSNGGKLAIVYRVPAQNLPTAENIFAMLARGGAFIQPQQKLSAAWNDAFELLSYSIEATDAAKRNLEVTLFFHTLKPMSDDYTFSIKARDAKDRVWGQEDKWLGDNSYATSQWSPGDVIIEKFYPGLNACAPAGEYRITVEAYNPATMQTLGEPITLGTTRADASPSNRIEDLDIATPLDVELAPQMRLLGYTLTPDTARAGDSFSLSLFWRGVGNGMQSRANIKLRDATNREFVLREQNILLPMEGRGLCAFFDLTVPPDASGGAGSILLNDAKIIPLAITR